jgi:hypothetical protein
MRRHAARNVRPFIKVSGDSAHVDRTALFPAINIVDLIGRLTWIALTQSSIQISC